MTTLAQVCEELQSLDERGLKDALDYVRIIKARPSNADPDNPPIDAETWEAIEDTRLGRNLSPPYKTAEEMFAAIDAEDEAEEQAFA
jgi:hypothetical protein